jgi:stage V sporulation protein SpoVS
VEGLREDSDLPLVAAIVQTLQNVSILAIGVSVVGQGVPDLEILKRWLHNNY